MKTFAILLFIFSVWWLDIQPSSAQIPYSAFTRVLRYRVEVNRLSIYRYRYTQMNRLKQYQTVYSYTSLGPVWSYYFGMYGQLARLKGYYIIDDYDPSLKCSNFKTNTYGDFLGYFNCPHFTEPTNYTYCCGESSYNFCCDDSSKHNPSTGPEPASSSMVIGLAVGLTILGVGIIAAIIFFCCYCCNGSKRSSRAAVGTMRPMMTIQSSTGGVTVSTTQMGPPPFGAPPPYSTPGYPTQQTATTYGVQMSPYPKQPAAYPVQVQGPPPPYPTASPAQPIATPLAQPVLYPPPQPTGDDSHPPYPSNDPAYPPPQPN